MKQLIYLREIHFLLVVSQMYLMVSLKVVLLSMKREILLSRFLIGYQRLAQNVISVLLLVRMALLDLSYLIRMRKRQNLFLQLCLKMLILLLVLIMRNVLVVDYVQLLVLVRWGRKPQRWYLIRDMIKILIIYLRIILMISMIVIF